jgi:hypothetical protein
MANLKKWRVLLLCAGRSTREWRPQLVEHLRTLGFDANVYSKEGYPTDPTVDNVSACVEAIGQHDVVIAVIDEEEGTEVDPDALEATVRKELLEKGLLPPPGSPVPPPTITHLEVEVAQALGKPTFILMSEKASEAKRALEGMLGKGELTPRAKAAGAAPVIDLLEAEEFEQLEANYEMPHGGLASFRHLRFIRRLEKNGWVRYHGQADTISELKKNAADALSHVPQALLKDGFGQIRLLLENERTPLGAPSIADLLDEGLIEVPPYRFRSGTGSGELWEPGSDRGLLAEWLLGGRSVLLLGDPGLGKSTAALLAYASLESAARKIPPHGVLRGRWRDLDVADEDWSGTVRRLLGLTYGREPWPASLELPRLNWVIVLDGLDESPLSSIQATQVLRHLGEAATLLVTCRERDHGRYLEAGGSTFSIIVELESWDDKRLEAYAGALEKAGRELAAEAVRGSMRLGRRPELISYPLWLTMLTYLAENEEHFRLEPFDDLGLLRRTMGAVANVESRRHGQDDVPALEAAWRRIAWKLHVRRREGHGPLTEAELANEVGLALGDACFIAACSLLDVGDGMVSGFRHEVVHAYWLGEEIAVRLPGAGADEVVELLRWQRSAIANDAVRQRLRRDGRAPESVATLRSRFFDIPAGPPGDFVKNQILYFLGRLDDPTRSREFLAGVWRSDEPEFVRYSAAFNGAMIGAAGVEEDYYHHLQDDADSDSLNRGYHMFYHGDIDLLETQMPYRDEDYSVPARRSVEVLIDRLRRDGPENKRLRRIELLTLRRFIETRGAPEGGLLKALDEGLLAIEREQNEEPLKASIAEEVSGVRRAAGL